jgi:hypothetical protein
MLMMSPEPRPAIRGASRLPQQGERDDGVFSTTIQLPYSLLKISCSVESPGEPHGGEEVHGHHLLPEGGLEQFRLLAQLFCTVLNCTKLL